MSFAVVFGGPDRAASACRGQSYHLLRRIQVPCSSRMPRVGERGAFGRVTRAGIGVTLQSFPWCTPASPLPSKPAMRSSLSICRTRPQFMALAFCFAFVFCQIRVHSQSGRSLRPLRRRAKKTVCNTIVSKGSDVNINGAMQAGFSRFGYGPEFAKTHAKQNANAVNCAARQKCTRKGTPEFSSVCGRPVVSTRGVQTRLSSKCDRLIHSSQQCQHTNLGNASGLPGRKNRRGLRLPRDFS